jgi:threonylcarbamoyladenosine tRNA methylthiotransferase MtaB
VSSSSPTFRIVTLGCRTNQYESRAYQSQLLSLGYREATEAEDADICIVNTCTVTETAETSSKQAVQKLQKQNPKAKILVTGCAAERNPTLFHSLVGAAAVVPNQEKESLLKLIRPEEELPEFRMNIFDEHTRAFVKVQDGCNSFCSYCIIPYVRGRSRSRTIDSILDEVKGLVDKGYKEVVLTGINIGDFDGGNPKKPVTLAELTAKVDEIPGIERIRISSIDPDEVDDALLDVVVNGKKTCHSMHIVLQSGSNVVLKRMNRKYTRQMFFDTIDRLKRASADFTFTTDVITGFPGETERDHEETLEAIRHVQFAKVHMFPYSDRPGTKAFSMPGKVDKKILLRRKQEIMRLAEHVAYSLRSRYVGREMVVLTEKREEGNTAFIPGHTENFLRVLVASPSLEENSLVRVRLVENRADALVAEVIS